MLRIHKATNVSVLDRTIAGNLSRVFGLDSEPIGPPTLVPKKDPKQEQDYSFMLRLLEEDDYRFLANRVPERTIRTLRRERRLIYQLGLIELRAEVLKFRAIQERSQVSVDQWKGFELVRYWLLSESALIELRFLGWKAHWMKCTAKDREIARESLRIIFFEFLPPVPAS